MTAGFAAGVERLQTDTFLNRIAQRQFSILVHRFCYRFQYVVSDGFPLDFRKDDPVILGSFHTDMKGKLPA